MVPIDRRDRPGIIREVDSACRGEIGEATIACVQKKAVSLVPAVGHAKFHQFDELPESRQVVGCGFRRDHFFRRMRHDLSPVETSQVVGALAGDVTVGHNQILPPVVVQVDPFTTP